MGGTAHPTTGCSPPPKGEGAMGVVPCRVPLAQTAPYPAVRSPSVPPQQAPLRAASTPMPCLQGIEDTAVPVGMISREGMRFVVLL